MKSDVIRLIGYEKRLDEIAPDRMSTFDKGLYDVCVAMNKDRGYGYFKSRVYRLIDDIETYLPKDRAMKIVKDVVKKGASSRPMRLMFRQKQPPSRIKGKTNEQGAFALEIMAEYDLQPTIQMLKAGNPALKKCNGEMLIKGCDGLPKDVYSCNFNEIFYAKPLVTLIPQESIDKYLNESYYMYAFLPQYANNILEWDVDDEIKIFLLLKVCEILDEYGYEIDKYCILPISKKNYL